MKRKDNTEDKLNNNAVMPNDWKLIKLGELFEFKNGINASKENYGNGIKFINVMEVIYNYYITENIIPGSVVISDKQFEIYSVKKGDVLFNRTSEIIEEIGLASVYLGNEKVVFGGFVIRGVSKSSVLFDEFKKYCFRSEFVRDQIIKGGQGAVRSNIGQGDLEKVELAIPPLPEQRAIAHILSLMDEAINKNNQLIAQKELRKKWLMQNLLTGKKRLKGFSGEWREYSYEKLLKVVKRNFDWNENELYKLISVRRRSGGIFFREALYGHQIMVKNLRTANEGDFLFSKMQILHGASALVTKEFAGAKISGSYIAVVAKEAKLLNMEFFDLYSQTQYFYHQTFISSYGVHIEKMTFDFDTFLQHEMSLPTIKEQTAIAQILQTADKEIQLLKTKTDKLKEQKKWMMQVLLTGKKRVKI